MDDVLLDTPEKRQRFIWKAIQEGRVTSRLGWSQSASTPHNKPREAGRDGV